MQSPILITVDLEDWFQVENLRSVFPVHSWDSCELRIEANTQKLLDLFDQFRVQATFFVLGWIAERCPRLVKEIKSRNHEVASHGYGHITCSQLSKEALREDLRRSKSILEDITGQPVIGYRAPNFSLTKELLELLGDLGYLYDSSWNPGSLVRRNGNGKDLKDNLFKNGKTVRNGVIELPVSNLKIGQFLIPFAGGGYFRFWPLPVFQRGISHILKSEGRYVFYFHPWEVDIGQPRIQKIQWLKQFRHYLNLAETYTRLTSFIKNFQGDEFITCSEYLKLRW
jgi:polysaccharide deacetylase family protein (PEP-CTERM system associated)